MSIDTPENAPGPDEGAVSRGPRLNHVVLTVRDIEASHRFYVDALGFEKCGEYHGERYVTPMWFYRSGPHTHHELALVQALRPDDVAPAGEWPGFFPEATSGLNHLAIGYGSPAEWLERLQVLTDLGVAFVRRGNHGMTHSAYVLDPDGHCIEVVYDLPAEVWSRDVEAALNYFEAIEPDGPEALTDSTAYPRFG